jgi:hypothetical protein
MLRKYFSNVKIVKMIKLDKLTRKNGVLIGVFSNQNVLSYIYPKLPKVAN